MMRHEKLLLTVGESQGLGLSLPGDLSFDEWRDIGEKLCAGQHLIQWKIGDWWAYGDHRYGERAKAAADGIFGISFGTIANMASVARRFESSRRHEVLTFGHHQEVASLPAPEADALLERAERENLSTRDLRAEVKKLIGAPGQFSVTLRADTLNAFIQSWNKLSPDLRTVAAELIEAANDQEIEPMRNNRDTLTQDESAALIDDVDRWCRRTGANYNKLAVLAGIPPSTRHRVKIKKQALSSMVAARLMQAMKKHRHGIEKSDYKKFPKPWGGPFRVEPMRAKSEICSRCGSRKQGDTCYCRNN